MKKLFSSMFLTFALLGISTQSKAVTETDFDYCGYDNAVCVGKLLFRAMMGFSNPSQTQTLVFFNTRTNACNDRRDVFTTVSFQKGNQYDAESKCDNAFDSSYRDNVYLLVNGRCETYGRMNQNQLRTICKSFQ